MLVVFSVLYFFLVYNILVWSHLMFLNLPLHIKKQKMIHVASTFPQVNLDLLSALPAGHSGYCSHCCWTPAGQWAPGHRRGRWPPLRSLWTGWQQLGVRFWGLGSGLGKPSLLPGAGSVLLGVSRSGEGHSGALGPSGGRWVVSVSSKELADHTLLVAGLVGHWE